jgi:hypothetical protein
MEGNNEYSFCNTSAIKGTDHRAMLSELQSARLMKLNGELEHPPSFTSHNIVTSPKLVIWDKRKNLYLRMPFDVSM